MATQSKTAGKIRLEITRFSNSLSSGLDKAERKFVHQTNIIFKKTEDIKLCNIGRSLGEEIPLKKTENRLSRQMNDGDLAEFLSKKLVPEGKWWIKEEAVLLTSLLFVMGSMIFFREGNFQTRKNHLLEQCLSRFCLSRFHFVKNFGETPGHFRVDFWGLGCLCLGPEPFR